jgi:hypothetical protein
VGGTGRGRKERKERKRERERKKDKFLSTKCQAICTLMKLTFKWETGKKQNRMLEKQGSSISLAKDGHAGGG